MDHSKLVIGVDPGMIQSGYCRLRDDGKVCDHGILPNKELLEALSPFAASELVIEMLEARGNAVGQETFVTILFAGRLAQAGLERGMKVSLVLRSDVRIHLCGTKNSNDSNVWQAIVDRYGGSSAVGKKSAPGPLYGIKSHSRAALAVGLAWLDGVRSDELAREEASLGGEKPW